MRAFTRPVDQDLGRLARGIRGEHPTQFGVLEIRPQTVRTEQEGIARLQIVGRAEVDRRRFVAAQRGDQDIAVGMDQRLLGRDLALADQLLDVGMIGRLRIRTVAAKTVETIVAAMHPADFSRLQQQHDGGAVRILFVDEARRLDQHVRLVEARFKHCLRRLGARRVLVEIVARGMNHLLRRQRSARMPTNAVGNDGERDAPALGWGISATRSCCSLRLP